MRNRERDERRGSPRPYARRSLSHDVGAPMSATVTIDFTEPAIRADPQPTYARLRAEAPVFWNGNAWLISRYDDIVALLNDPRMSSARTDAHYAVLPPEVRAELRP